MVYGSYKDKLYGCFYVLYLESEVMRQEGRIIVRYFVDVIVVIMVIFVVVQLGWSCIYDIDIKELFSFRFSLVYVIRQ